MYPDEGAGPPEGAELADDGKDEYGGGGPDGYIDDGGLAMGVVFTERSVDMGVG